MNVSLGALAGSLPLLGAYFVVKITAKFVGVYPASLRWLRPHATYTTLLMSTGLTFGTISSLYGLNAGIIDRTQFSVLITTVILSAIVPTFLAQRFFSPPVNPLTTEQREAIEDEEFEPAR
jgi:Kef-type K+ transport system membrane component KefB